MSNFHLVKCQCCYFVDATHRVTTSVSTWYLCAECMNTMVRLCQVRHPILDARKVALDIERVAGVMA